jgi:hypothetical protein
MCKFFKNYNNPHKIFSQSGLSPQPPLTEEELAALLIESEPEEYDGHEDDEDREAEEEQ